VVLSSSGRYLAAGSWDGQVRIWDCLDATEIGAWSVGDRVGSLAFHPSEEYVLATVEGRLQLLRPGAEERTLKSIGEREAFKACAFSPNGTLVAVASLYYGVPIRVLDVTTGDIVLELKNDTGANDAMSFSPNGTHLALGGAGLTIIELGTGRTVITSEPASEIKAIKFSPDGTQIISGGFDGVARVWDRASGALYTAVDVGISCYGADVAETVGFGERSFLLRADWERWWAGAALRERLSRCGAVDITTDSSDTQNKGHAPRAVWDGSKYSAWLSALRWVSTEEAYFLRHGREVSGVYESSNLFLGAANGTIR
jgi:WD40 repeat protein